MDIERYFQHVSFTPVGMDKGFYIYEARINTGDEMIIRVISKNRGTHLHKMKWKMLWGLPVEKAMGRHRLQNFFPDQEFSQEKGLLLDSEEPKKTVFMNKNHPYLVTLVNNENCDNPFSDCEKITLIEAIGSPQFEVRRFG